MSSWKDPEDPNSPFERQKKPGPSLDSPFERQRRPGPPVDEFEEEPTCITQAVPLVPTQNERRDRMYLVVISGNLTGQMFRLDDDQVLLGRGKNCQICIRDGEISRSHAWINREENGTALLTDLNSSNGTFVNGNRIKDCYLQDGDRIQLGRTTILKFSVHDEIEESFQRRMYENAIRDGLTQIFNRRYFDERLVDEFSFARRHQTSLSVLIMDLDRFKSVNDTYGHPVGDRVLQHVASVVATTIRKEDVFARYGGEEFAIITRGLSPAQAAVLGERIRQIVEMQIIPLHDGSTHPTLTSFPSPQDSPGEIQESLRVTVSIGIATMEQNSLFQSPAALLQLADQRLLQAKTAGRNCIVTD